MGSWTWNESRPQDPGGADTPLGPLLSSSLALPSLTITRVMTEVNRERDLEVLRSRLEDAGG